MLAKKLLRVAILPFLLFISVNVFSQSRVITGKVTDSKSGAALSGVSVVAKGSIEGTSTDAEGTFSLSVGPNVTILVVSSIGYEVMEVNIVGKTNVDVVLIASTSDLGEVVVVGYGSARKRDVTGSVTSIKSKDFNQGVFTAPDQLIQGKAAGVQIINNTGAPGGATTVRIRGIGSIRSGNSPLIVVDGVPLSGGSAAPGLGTALGSAPGNNPLNFINPADIESMDVLKDASATAIYGSRGANGVIQITTKKGKSGTPKMEFNTSLGTSSLLKRIEVLDGDGYRAALQKYGINSGNFGTSVDALDEVLRNALTTNNNIAISGGNESGRYRVSMGYLNQEGIVKESGFKKYSGSITSTFKFFDSKRLTFDFGLFTTHTTTNGAPISNNAGFQGSLIGNALQWNPTHALRNPDGSIWIVDPLLGNTTINPLALLAAYDDINNLTSVLASISPTFKITSDLEYKFLYSVNYETGRRESEIRNWLNQQGIEGRGFAQIAHNRSVNQALTHTLSYNKNITEKTTLGALIGAEYLKFDFKGSGMTATQFVDYPGIKYTDYMQNAPPSERSIYSFASPIAELQSYFGRVNIGYDNRFTVTATFRADGSTRFGENNKYGYFPSFAGAWSISNEKFMEGANFVKDLKLRVGWGQTGNQEFPRNDAALRVVLIGQGVNQINDNLPNPDLKWETNTTTNIGIDFTILDSRLSASIDYYKRETTDPIFQLNVTAPGPSDSRFFKNLDGTIQNQGVEFALRGAIVRQRDLNWNLNVNAAFQDNELKDFVGTYETGALSGQGSSGATVQRLANGQPLNVYYLRRFEGLDKTTGQSKYTDDGNTLFYSGSPNPKMVLGLSTDISFKKWYFVANMNGAFGHYLYNETATNVISIGNLGTRNIASSLIGGDIMEATSNPVAASTRFLEKGNYMKLANATVSYNLGRVGKVINNANISLTAQNLFVITNFSGFDPEVNVDKNVNGIPSFGIEYIPYPTARTIILGINFSF